MRIVTLQRQAYKLGDGKPVLDNSCEAVLRRLSEAVPSRATSRPAAAAISGSAS